MGPQDTVGLARMVREDDHASLTAGEEKHEGKRIPIIERGIMLISGDEGFSIVGNLDHRVKVSLLIIKGVSDFFSVTLD